MMVHKPMVDGKVKEQSPLKFERPVDEDTAEEVIKKSENDVLRLRKTRVEIKRIEEEQKRKRKKVIKRKEIHLLNYLILL
eukprot:g921.t1